MPRLRRSVLVTNRSSPTSWTLLADAVGQRLPAVPVLLVHAVLDRDDRVARRPARPSRRPSRPPTASRPSCSSTYDAVVVRSRWWRGPGRWRRRRRARSRRPRCPPSAPRAPPRWTRGPARSRPRRRPRCARPRSCRVPLRRVEDLGAHPQALREGGRAHRHDHELLEVDLVVGVRAAVEHVHHRHGQHVRGLAAEVAPERLAAPRRRRPWRRRARRRGSRWPRGGPCSGVPSSSIIARSTASWSAASRPCTASASSPLTLATACATPLPPQRSPPSRSSTASNSPVDAPEGTAARPLAPEAQHHVDLDGGVAAAVEDLPGVDMLDLRSCVSRLLCSDSGRRRCPQGELGVGARLDRGRTAANSSSPTRKRSSRPAPRRQLASATRASSGAAPPCAGAALHLLRVERGGQRLRQLSEDLAPALRRRA